MEKRLRTHDLAAIKAAFASAATLNRTKVAARDASSLGMDAEAVVAVIQALRYPADFDKSATSHHDPQRWHDSYKPLLGQRSEEHTSELQSLMRISYAVFCLKKKN